MKSIGYILFLWGNPYPYNLYQKDIPNKGKFLCHFPFQKYQLIMNMRMGHEFRFEIHALFCYPLAEGMIKMKFTSISQSNIDELCIAFESCLTKHDITFKYVDMTEDNGIISFIFCDDPENARSVDMESERFIGLDTDYIAKEILEPILPKLKEFAQYKIID
jgi:hypothetical protein